MKKVLLAAAVTLGLSAFLSGQDSQKVSGYLVDSVCAGNHAKEAGYGANHTNKCNLMDVCKKSGFSIITEDQKVIKLDAAGAEKALALLTSTSKEKDLKVVVTGKVDGGTIAVQSIALE